MFNSSLIEINRSALESNIKFIQDVIGKDVKLSSVVKGNAYGHGIESFVPIVEECGIRHFSVYSADEAVRVKNITTDNAEIMIMGMIDNDELDWAIQNEIGFFVFEFDRLIEAIATAKNLGMKAYIHLEVETGMNRTGFEKKEMKRLIEFLKQNKEHYEFQGLCTHYAGAESIANYKRVQNQITKFNRIYKRLYAEGLIPHYRHTACSAAAVSYPKTRMDMVRIGIMQYGFWPSKETLIRYVSKNRINEDPLRRIISWKSRVMSIKEVEAGEFVGYGTSFLALTKMKIATVPVGYSHGFSRSLSNQGRALIHGHLVHVIGMVNMNMMTIDVTNVPNVRKGDEVVLIGTQGDHTISVASFGEMSNFVNYELLTRLPNEIPRAIVKDEPIIEEEI
jgi:alanine racemase